MLDIPLLGSTNNEEAQPANDEHNYRCCPDTTLNVQASVNRRRRQMDFCFEISTSEKKELSLIIQSLHTENQTSLEAPFVN